MPSICFELLMQYNIEVYLPTLRAAKYCNIMFTNYYDPTTFSSNKNQTLIIWRIVMAGQCYWRLSLLMFSFILALLEEYEPRVSIVVIKKLVTNNNCNVKKKNGVVISIILFCFSLKSPKIIWYKTIVYISKTFFFFKSKGGDLVPLLNTPLHALIDYEQFRLL